MDGIDFVIVIAVLLLVGLAVAAGLQFAQDRVESQLAEVSKEVRRRQVARYRTGPLPTRYCATCGHELHPPI